MRLFPLAIAALMAVQPGAMLLAQPAGGQAASAPGSVPAPEPEPDRLVAAKRLIAEVFPEKRRDSIVTQSIQSVNGAVLTGILNSPTLKEGGQNPEVQAVVKDFMERRNTAVIAMVRSELPNMVTAMERAYARRFTVAQMDDIRAFFMTPSGRAYTELSPGLMADPDLVVWQQNLMRRSMADAQRDVPGLFSKVKAIREKAEKQKK